MNRNTQMTKQPVQLLSVRNQRTGPPLHEAYRS